MNIIQSYKLNMKTNKLVVLYSSDFPPLNSCVKKNKVLNLSSTLGLIGSIKNIKQNI